MECGKLTAKLRDAMQVCFIKNGKKVKCFKNIEIPDEIKKLPYQGFEFSVPVTGTTPFKIMFEEGVLPKVWPEARTRKSRKAKLEDVPISEIITTRLQAALGQVEVEGHPMAEIAEAAAQDAEISAELNGQKLTITGKSRRIWSGFQQRTGERCKALIEAVKVFVDAPAVYKNNSDSPMLSVAMRSVRLALNAKTLIAEQRSFFLTLAGFLCLKQRVAPFRRNRA